MAREIANDLLEHTMSCVVGIVRTTRGRRSIITSSVHMPSLGHLSCWLMLSLITSRCPRYLDRADDDVFLPPTSTLPLLYSGISLSDILCLRPPCSVDVRLWPHYRSSNFETNSFRWYRTSGPTELNSSLLHQSNVDTITGHSRMLIFNLKI